MKIRGSWGMVVWDQTRKCSEAVLNDNQPVKVVGQTLWQGGEVNPETCDAEARRSENVGGKDPGFTMGPKLKMMS